MCIYGILLEMVGECAKNQLVEDMTLVDGQIVVNLRVTPVREILGSVINLKKRLVHRSKATPGL
jgi:hypothetical protein